MDSPPIDSKKDNVLRLMQEGKLRKVNKGNRPYSTLFNLESNQSTGFAECNVCGMVLCRGGSLTRHVKQHFPSEGDPEADDDEFEQITAAHHEEREIDCKLSAVERVLSKSSRISAESIESKMLTSDVLLMAMLLSPQYKGFKRFSQKEKEKAVKGIQKLLGNVPQPYASVSPAKKKKFMDDDEDEPAADELTTYLAIPPTSKTSVEKFWSDHKATFPRLFVVARQVFGVLPSEAACERHFSLVSRLVTKYRTVLAPSLVERIVLGSQLSRMYDFE